jgi:hypothetical protein
MKVCGDGSGRSWDTVVLVLVLVVVLLIEVE